MNTAASERAAAIFFALSNVAPGDRARLLDERCAGDALLRREVEKLLGGLDVSDSFLSLDPRSATHKEEIIQPAGTAIGGFVIIRTIGSGGTGLVYLAHQQRPARIVALKVLRREFVASTVQRRFEIEAELLGHLQHPGIAQIYAAHPGDDSSPPFIAMELVNGPPLTDYADRHQLSIHDRVELIARVCDAVQHAHQRGIIHRDLKPANILVNEDGQPKVLDFGVARTAGAEVGLTTIETETGQLLGTLAYMSPEQIEAVPHGIDTRTDIHSLGVILFRLLAGRLPFGHDDPPLPELARRIVQDDAPRLGTIVPEARGDLEIIVARALAKDKERRYTSAASLAADLRRYLTGQPISASADSAWYVVRRRLARYRLALGLSGVAVAALAGLAGWATFERTRADRANLDLQRELANSNIERGRAVNIAGNLPIAEELVWRELFREPGSRHAKWALWEIYSKESSLWIQAPHQGGTWTLRFSPDNRYLLTAGREDGMVRLLDVESGGVIRDFASTPKSGTRRAFFTPDGSTIVAGSMDGTVRVWDVATGALRREMPRVVPSLEDFAIAGAGAHAVTLGPGGLLQVWDLSSGHRIADFSQAVHGTVMIAADPTGTLLLAGAQDGTVTALDIERQTRLWEARGHERQVSSLAIGPNARLGASGGLDAMVQVWDIATGERLRTLATENGSVRNLAFARSGRKIASAGQWRTQLWDLERPLEPPKSFGGAEGQTDVDLRPDLRFLATCHGASGLVRLWDLAPDPRVDHWPGHTGAVTGLAVGAGPDSILSGGADGSVTMWRPGQPASERSLKTGGRVGGLAVSENKRWIVSSGYPGKAGVWQLDDGRRVEDFGQIRSARAALFVDGDRRLIVGESDGNLSIWDWTDGAARSHRRVRSHDSEVLAMAARGSRLFVAHRETIVYIRDAASGREIRSLKPSASPFSLAVSPDGRLLAAGTWPGIVDIWDVESGAKLQALKGPTALVTGLDFSPDGSLLALSSRDGSTRLWDVAAQDWLATVASRRPGAERVRFLPSGQQLAIGYEDGEVEIRDLQYFFRYAAGHAAHQLEVFRRVGESFPRSAEVLAWSRGVLSPPSRRP